MLMLSMATIPRYLYLCLLIFIVSNYLLEVSIGGKLEKPPSTFRLYPADTPAGVNKCPVPQASEVSGKRVGIVGLGNIGMRVARRMEGFDCSIAYNSKRKKANVSYPYYENVRDLASNSDILIVACALVPETHHVISKDVLRALGRRGVVVNIGRDGLVDEKELVKFLVRGEIGGAGLEVFEDKPNVPKELFKLDNVVLSPHRS